MAIPPEEKPEGAPEWMVSYADMITIIMAFFVIMFAVASEDDVPKREAILDSIEYRFGPLWRPFGRLMGIGQYPNGAPYRSVGDTGKGQPYFDALLSDDDPRSGAKFGRANIPGEGDLASIGGSVYFAADSAELEEAQIARLQRIAEACAGKAHKIEVLGHTWNQPLPRNSPFRDHWDLAYARCRRTTELLVSMGIDPKRIRMGVAGSTEPVTYGNPAAYARRNSRVDVYLLDLLVTDFEPRGVERKPSGRR